MVVDLFPTSDTLVPHLHNIFMTNKTLVDTAYDIVAWLKDYAEKSGRKAWVVGVSGGVDSSLVSTLCAMTGLPTHCVILPCVSKRAETDRGLTHIMWLENRFDNITSNRIDLTSTFSSFFGEVCCYNDKNYNSELGLANAKSRLRMIALYHVATCVDGLVVGTGNKVEDFGIGFFTKYGDGGVDISPIADLLKSEVRQMCRELGVLPELSEAVPTDGLWDDARTDEDAIGATYDELEWALQFRQRNETGLFRLSNRENQVLAIYDRLHRITAHKMAPIPTFVRA